MTLPTNDRPGGAAWPPQLAPFIADKAEAAQNYVSARIEPDASELQLLVLEASAHRLAVDILQVAEVAKAPSLTFVPRTPRWHLGIAAIRGTLLPIVSLAQVLDLAGPSCALPAAPQAWAAPAKWTPARVVVLRHAAPIGLAVDAVVGVVRLARGALLPPGEERAAAVPWAAGFAPLPGGLTAVLAVDALQAALRSIGQRRSP